MDTNTFSLNNYTLFHHLTASSDSDMVISESPATTRSNSEDLSTKICMNSKKIYKKREKYNKISNEIRLKLVEAVEQNGEVLKAVAKRFHVNYSSAKSIIQTYKKEGRVLRKKNHTHPTKVDNRKDEEAPKTKELLKETCLPSSHDFDCQVQPEPIRKFSGDFNTSLHYAKESNPKDLISHLGFMYKKESDDKVKNWLYQSNIETQLLKISKQQFHPYKDKVNFMLEYCSRLERHLVNIQDSIFNLASVNQSTFGSINHER